MSALLLLYLCRPDISLHHNRFCLDCLQIMWTVQPANILNRAYHNLWQFSFNVSSRWGQNLSEKKMHYSKYHCLIDLCGLDKKKMVSFWAVDIHYWVMLSFLPTNIPKSHSSGLLSVNSWSGLYSCLGLFWGAGLALGLVDQRFTRADLVSDDQWREGVL